MAGIGLGTCQKILTVELGMHHTKAKSVPRILTDEQIQQCVDVCTELQQPAPEDETLS